MKRPTPASRVAASSPVRALGAEPVRQREAAVEVLEVADARERGRLVAERVWAGGRDASRTARGSSKSSTAASALCARRLRGLRW
jgi:hypothetical protein